MTVVLFDEDGGGAETLEKVGVSATDADARAMIKCAPQLVPPNPAVVPHSTAGPACRKCDPSPAFGGHPASCRSLLV